MIQILFVYSGRMLFLQECQISPTPQKPISIFYELCLKIKSTNLLEIPQRQHQTKNSIHAQAKLKPIDTESSAFFR